MGGRGAGIVEGRARIHFHRTATWFDGTPHAIDYNAGDPIVPRRKPIQSSLRSAAAQPWRKNAKRFVAARSAAVAWSITAQSSKPANTRRSCHCFIWVFAEIHFQKAQPNRLERYAPRSGARHGGGKGKGPERVFSDPFQSHNAPTGAHLYQQRVFGNERIGQGQTSGMKMVSVVDVVRAYDLACLCFL